MVFSSVLFIFIFLPLSLLLFYLAPKKAKSFVILLSSLLFYAWGEIRYTSIIICSILINYFFGLLLDQKLPLSLIFRKAIFIIAIFVDLFLLGYYKYYDFMAENIDTLFGSVLLPIKRILLPLGISFFTFQALGYVIDVYRGNIRSQKNIIHFAAFISMYPQLIAGPIVKYRDIEDSLLNPEVTVDRIYYGIKRFVVGLSKKVLIANYMGMLCDRILSAGVSNLSSGLLWFAHIIYAFQIYYDFSGYSDMAIGLGNLMGFDFPENFNYPYMARSITDFWRRWHISLTTWFRDNVYIPLGGNRKGQSRTALNILIVFFLTGLWHGAGWQFVVFGLYHALLQLFERFVINKSIERSSLTFMPSIISFILITIGWVFFRSANLSESVTALSQMFTLAGGSPVYSFAQFFNAKTAFLIVIAVLLSGPIQTLFPSVKIRFQDKTASSVPEMILILTLFILSCSKIIAGSYNPFIYFQF